MKPQDVRSVRDLRKAIQAGAHPTYVFFWNADPAPSGELGASCLSQWWPATFDADGHRFATAEHYMMWRKAVLFDDQARAQEILQSRSPAHAKAVGRLVEGFDHEVWLAHREQIVLDGSMAKFGCNPELNAYLQKTGRRVLVEASPVDKIWGIGFAEDHPFAKQPAKWRGLNLLGFALMEARAKLAS